MEVEDRLGRALAAVRRTVGPYVAGSERGEGRVISQAPVAEISRELEIRRWIRDGGMGDSELEAFLGRYLAHSTRVHHPASLAHQVAVPGMGAAVGELVHGLTNNPMAIYEMGAPAAAIEVEVIDWMLRHVGFDPARGAGVLTGGGSLANLTALLAARARAAPDAWRNGTPQDLAILAPASAHYSISRAAGILGLGEQAVVRVDTDALERIDPERLPLALDRAHAAGRRPFALVAAACATSTGLYDDLAAAADFCDQHGLWLHADGAHGASALLSDRHRPLLDGVDRADSVTWDAHKLLRTAGLCTGLLLRDRAAMEATFDQQASYLFYDRDSEGVDLITRTVECTKAELGLKLFLELATAGERGLGDYVASRFDLAREAHAMITTRPGFSCPYLPESNILCFRVEGDDALQLAIRERLIADGSAHLSSATISGSRHLRMVITAPATTEATIAAVLDTVEAARAALA